MARMDTMLRGAFTPGELTFLLEQRHFAERCAEATSITEFEAVVLLGHNLLEAHAKAERWRNIARS
jgi:hypothetical protein